MAGEVMERGGAGADALRTRVKETLSSLASTGELPSVPAVAASALAIADDPDADVDNLCSVIQTDVGIAARVFRLANSAVYGRRTSCKTLREGVVILGPRPMRDVLVAASLRQLYTAKNAVAAGLWDHALAVGLATRELAPLLGFRKGGGEFLPGLFHDVGRIAFLISDPDAFEVIARLGADGKDNRGSLEREWFGFDHAAAGAVLAADWGLAPEACEAIRWHHEPARADRGRALAELLNLADRIAHAIDLGGGEPVAGDPLQGKLSPEDLQAAAERTRAAFDGEKSIFE
jgi:HD-like signal output (HDOD) protein